MTSKAKLAVVLVAISSFIPGLAIAGTIRIDFNDATSGGFFTQPYFEDGFRIQALTCHYDIPISAGPELNPIDGTQWMGFDQSGCLDEDSAHLRLDLFGRSFDILSLDVVKPNWLITSSNGGSILTCEIVGCDFAGTGALSLSGTEWSGVTYIDFFTTVGSPVGFDNVIVTSVPEPSTIMLLSVGVFCLGLARRRRVESYSQFTETPP